MKRWLIITSIFFFFFKLYGQKNRNYFFFDEIGVSVNRTNLKDNNTEDRYGFGIGLYHSFMSNKKFNFIFGFEFNRTSQFKNRMYEGRYAYSTDLIYNINSISIPFNLKFNIGKIPIIFFEAGVFMDLLINGNRKGIMHKYSYSQNSYEEFEINRKADLSSVNYGFAFGLGIRIPVDKFELIIKPDYKLGLLKLYSYNNNIYNRYFRLTIGMKKKE